MALVKVQTGPQILCDYAVSDVPNKTYFSAFCGISFTGLWNAGASHTKPSLQENLIMTCNDKFALWNYLLPIWSSILLGDNSACARPAINPRSWCTGRQGDETAVVVTKGDGAHEWRRSKVLHSQLPLFLFLHFFFKQRFKKKLMKIQQ